MKRRLRTTRCGLWQSVHSAWRDASTARGSMKSDPQRLFGEVQSMNPGSLNRPPMSCTSLPAPWSVVVIGMRRARRKSVSMFGTCGEAFSADLVAVVWHW